MKMRQMTRKQKMAAKVRKPNERNKNWNLTRQHKMRLN